MMDWTDRHCRFLHRQITARSLLYTEMVTAAAVIHGPRDRLLGFDPLESPLALQLGGSDPRDLAAATRIAAGFGFDEINLNAGCPSGRVQAGAFGAALMRDPALVADCVAAMIAASPVEVTVKCRIGVDDQIPEETLPAFLETLAAAGVRRFAIHARKAWLHGLSPKDNRQIPPLDHALVIAMKRDFPDLTIIINGGIASLDQAETLLGGGPGGGLDGVMIGRAAYHDPYGTLAGADARIFDLVATPPSRDVVIARMRPHIARHLAAGGRLGLITRHMLGLFHGQPGGRHWRRILAEGAHRPDAGLDLLDAALAATRSCAV